MRTVELRGGRLRLIDQRRLPSELHHLELTDYRQVAEAIATMAVRGAPAIGVAAAFGLCLAAREMASRAAAGDAEAPRTAAAALGALEEAASALRRTRPTAVNLGWATERVLNAARDVIPEAFRAAGALSAGTELPAARAGAALARAAARLEAVAQAMADADVAANQALGRHGQELLPRQGGVLTHCNAGALACVDYGTALGVIRAARAAGKDIHVYVGETRPVLQGARLTAWELLREGIPATLITDGAAAALMRQGKVQAVIVGADRVTANGDVVNKIGTYGLAVLARAHGVPFYAAVPCSTVDLSVSCGDQVPIEHRRPEEVTHAVGVRIAPQGVVAFNPAFDVTPHEYVTAIITEKGIVHPPYSAGLAALLQAPVNAPR